MDMNTLSIVILDSSSEKNEFLQNFNQSKKYKNDLEISKPTLKSACQVQEDNRTFLCCIKYDTAPSLMFGTDIIFAVILMMITLRGSIYSLVITMPILIIYVLPRLVTYVLYSQNPQSKEIFNIMFIVRIITGTIYTIFYATVSYLILSIDTTNNSNSESSGIIYVLVIFGILMYVIPTTISTIVDWYYIYVIKKMLDEME
eukprot:403354838